MLAPESAYDLIVFDIEYAQVSYSIVMHAVVLNISIILTLAKIKKGYVTGHDLWSLFFPNSSTQLFLNIWFMKLDINSPAVLVGSFPVFASWTLVLSFINEKDQTLIVKTRI